MVKAEFDIDGDRAKDIIISGPGIFATIAIIVVADLLITQGQLTLGVLEFLSSLFG